MRPRDPAHSMASATSRDQLKIEPARRLGITRKSHHKLEIAASTNATAKRLTWLTPAILRHIALEARRVEDARFALALAAGEGQRKPEGRLGEFFLDHGLTRFTEDPGHAAPEESATARRDTRPSRHAKGGPATSAGERDVLHVFALRRRRELRERRVARQITQQALVHARKLPRSRCEGGCSVQDSRSARAFRIARR